MLLLAEEGKTLTEIGEKVDFHFSAVKRCLTKYRKGRIEAALNDAKGRGRKSAITDEDKAWIKNLSCKKPEDFGYAQGLWTEGQGMGLISLLSLGFICGVAGQFGDLFASCLKRSADVKDFSETLPGHGGVLDRLDSVLLCAPVVLAFCILALS